MTVDESKDCPWSLSALQVANKPAMAVIDRPRIVQCRPMKTLEPVFESAKEVDNLSLNLLLCLFFIDMSGVFAYDGY
jgi:hypothetical protein